MANKRMFNLNIVDSDAFIDLSPEAQCLYFQLGMRADDDGIVDKAKRIMRIIGVEDAALQELVDKRFILTFPSGIIVIKHWCINNNIRKDRKTESRYQDELATLTLKENGAYTEKNKNGCQKTDYKSENDSQKPTLPPNLDNQVTDTCPSSDRIDIDIDIDIDSDIESVEGSMRGEASPQSSPSAQGTTAKGKKKGSTLSYEEIDTILTERNLAEGVKKMIHDWCEYKREKRQAYKRMGLNSTIETMVELVGKYGEDEVNGAMRQCMSSNYDGLILEKFIKQKGGNTNGRNGTNNTRDNRVSENSERSEPYAGSAEWYERLAQKAKDMAASGNGENPRDLPFT